MPCSDLPAQAAVMAACEHLVPALTARGKEALGSCVDEFSCDTDCFEPGGFRYLTHLARQKD